MKYLTLWWFLVAWLIAAVSAARKRARPTTAKKVPKKSTAQIVSGGDENDASYLYLGNRDVIEYEGDEDTDFKESSMPRVVQFYSPACVSISSFFTKWSMLNFVFVLLVFTKKNCHCYRLIAKDSNRCTSKWPKRFTKTTPKWNSTLFRVRHT
jgi:hypothetical protein